MTIASVIFVFLLICTGLQSEKVITIRGVVDLDHSPAFNCSKLLTPILEKRKRCRQQSATQVDICTVFAEDYHYMISFLIHHLSLGFEKIHVYNNDLKSTWYLHPSILCLSAADLITVVPWPGDGEFLNGLNHCHRARVLESRGLTYGKDMNANNLWMAIFDIDELLVLHQDQCVNSFVDKYPSASQIGINWAMYVPIAPFSDYAIFGHPEHLPADHRAVIDYDRSTTGTKKNESIPLVILPQDMLLVRMKENFHVKSMARPACVEKINSPHYMDLFASCPYTPRITTISGKTFANSPVSHAADRHVNYDIAQLNHYWSTSVGDFMRKVHRGRGIKQAGVYRNSADLPVRSKGPMMRDTVFHKLYGSYFNTFKVSCPECFDMSSVFDS